MGVSRTDQERDRASTAEAMARLGLIQPIALRLCREWPGRALDGVDLLSAAIQVGLVRPASEPHDKVPSQVALVFMTTLRPYTFVLLCMLLSACDSADPPDSRAKPKVLAPSTETALLKRDTQPAFQAEIQLPEPREPEPHAQAELITPTGQEQPSPVEKAAKHKVSSSSVTREKTPVPRVALDLSVPKELLKSLQPQDASADLDSKLLPPMFIEKAEDNPFQLNGRLITKDRQDVIEGAELQFQFKR